MEVTDAIKKAIVINWILQNVDESVVPNDEGNGGALVYNLVHLAMKDGKEYHYGPEQDEELEEWAKNGIDKRLNYPW